MTRMFCALALAGSLIVCGTAAARTLSPVSVEIVDAAGKVFREIPVKAQDGARRSYLQAEKGARYRVRVRNLGGERVGLVIAVDGRNIINGAKSELARTEPMYVVGAWESQELAGWRASLEAVNEFYFTEWSDSYAEAFGDASARGVIAVAVYREVAPKAALRAKAAEAHPQAAATADAAAPSEARSAAQKSARAQRDEAAGTGYGERVVDRAERVEFTARADADSRHFIKYEWRATLCRKRLIECVETNRFWDESTLGFAPPPPRRGR